jgi:hypothetical protein
MSFPVLAPSVREGSLPGWVGPVVAAVVVQVGLLAGYVARFGYDVSALVCVREDAVGLPPFEHVRTSLSKEGFDGQFYYAIARDPWHKQDQHVVVAPGYRHMRVLYPALGWLASGGGEPRRLLWALPGVNVAAFAGLAFFGALFAGRFGRSPWWGFFLPLLVNAGTPALRDLTDPVATLAVFGLIATYLLRGNVVALALWAAAAVFAREQNAAVVVLVAGLALVERRWLAAAAGAAALAAWGVWVWQLRQMYGTWPFELGNFDWPFAGMWYRWQHLNGDAAARSAPIHLAGLAYVAAQVVLSLLVPLYRAPRVVTLVALAGAALAVLSGPAIYMDGHSYTRVFVWMPLGVWLWAVHSGRTWPAVLLAPAMLWPAYALFQVWRR